MKKKILFLSLFLSCFVSFLLWKNFSSSDGKKRSDRIVSILQTGPEKEVLKTEYLAELLELSVDQESYLKDFDLREGEQKLLKCPLIEKAKLKKIFPGTLYIDYTVRQPCAWLGDYENLAFDEKGFVFFVDPFLSPKQLPEIILGLSTFGEEEGMGKSGARWHEPLSGKYFHLACELLKNLSQISLKHSFRILRIDVSHAYESSLGKREIVVMLEEERWVKGREKSVLCIFPRTLRLSTKSYAQQLGNYLVLKEKIWGDYRKQLQLMKETPETLRFQNKVIDFRVDKVAFIES